MTDKNSYRVRLRLKKDHSVVLPSALLDERDPSYFLLDYEKSDTFVRADRDDWEVSPPRPDERIQLRLKSDPSIVLPEARLVLEEVDRWRIVYPGTSANNILTKDDWEALPPPFEVPSGLGAVVQFSDGSAVVKVTQRTWASRLGAKHWTDAELMSVAHTLTVLSEGVDTWEQIR